MQKKNKPVAKAYRLIWSPEGRTIATVLATSEKAARRQAPAPYRKYLGEIAVEECKAWRAVVHAKPGDILRGATKCVVSSWFDSENEMKNWADAMIDQPGAGVVEFESRPHDTLSNNVRETYAWLRANGFMVATPDVTDDGETESKNGGL